MHVQIWHEQRLLGPVKVSDDMSSNTSNKLTRNRPSRTKTGCLCCRLRKKRCTEEKPICASCKKLKLPCSWPKADEFAWRLGLGIAGNTPARDAIKHLSKAVDPSTKSYGSDSRSTSSSAGSQSVCSPSRSTSLTPAASYHHGSLSDFIIGPWEDAFVLFSEATEASVAAFDEATKQGQPEDDQDTPLLRPLLSTSGTGLATDSTSHDVLHYYVTYTADRLLSQKPGLTNIWKGAVLQIAESDQLVRSAVLAVGGVHLAANMPGNDILEESTTRYVLSSIAGLQSAFKGWDGGRSGTADYTLRLMLVTCLLAEYECIRGNTDGNLQYHLRATSSLAKVLAARQNSDHGDLVAHLLEKTAYLHFLSALRFPRSDERSGNDSVDLLELIHDGRFELIKSYSTFGVYFGCAVELYEMIPALRTFYSTRNLEIITGHDLGCAASFNKLLDMILSWKPPIEEKDTRYKYTERWLNDLSGYQVPEQPDPIKEADRIGKAEESPMIASALAIQNSLLVYLHSAYLRHEEDQSRLLKATKPLVDETLDLCTRVKGTTWENTTWWPIMIIGSYAQTKEQRSRILTNFDEVTNPMMISTRGKEILGQIWNRFDYSFGLAGLSDLAGISEAYCFG